MPVVKAGDTRCAAFLRAGLLAAVVAVYAGVQTFDYVFDDSFFISGNPHVLRGVTLAGLRWSLTANVAGLWHPVTLWSHMLDVQLFGPVPAAHHLVNLLLHGLNVLTLFGVLRRLTGTLWRSALVAALFALHPLNVESVVWVAERKNLLSTLFLLLALGAYARHAARPGARRFLPVLFWFALGLCSKPMLVTFPFALLLLDFWPLRRPWSRAILWEKVPLLALAVVVGVVTYRAQRDFGAMAIANREAFPLSVRCLNAVAAYGWYLLKTVWPSSLGVLYAHPGAALPLWKPLLSLTLLGLVTAAAGLWHRTRPALMVGWLWFLGTLVPVIGLVQVGEQGMADRYAYVPLIGLFVAAAWTFPSPDGTSRRRAAGLAAGALALIVLAVVARVQTTHWRDNLTLYAQAVAVSPASWMMQANLGAELQKRGRLDEAIARFRELVRLRPDIPEARHNLAFALQMAGRREEAVAEFRETLRLNPAHPRADYNLGVALMKLGRAGEAVFHLHRATQVNPGHLNARLLLGEAWAAIGRRAEAREAFRQVLRLEPGNAAAVRHLETLGAR